MDDYSIAEILAELERREREGGAYRRYFGPGTRETYPKHWHFFDVGASYRQRLFMAANRVGKSTAFGCELTYHLTGIYPDDWKGKRFPGCTQWWVCGKSSETVRQILQPMLLGPIGSIGTGLIPKAYLDETSLTDAKKSSTGISSFKVRHVTGSFSLVEFKSYDQGRQAFEGTERSIWLDEEPPEEVYSECLLRTMTGDNILVMTFTPLKGVSNVVLAFSNDGAFEEGEVGVGKYVVNATWDDVPHLTPEAKLELKASIPPYQLDARTKGIPVLGSGAIWPVSEDRYVVDPFEIPKHWPRCYGLDTGRNTACIWLAHDRDSNVLYIYSEYANSASDATPLLHASSIKARGQWIRGVIDTSSHAQGVTDNKRLFDMFKDEGLLIQNADKAVEAGIFEVLDLLLSNRLKIFSTCTNLLREMRSYARDEKGDIIKKRDHSCDAARYAVFNRSKILWTEAEAKATLNPEVLPPLIEAPMSDDNWLLA